MNSTESSQNFAEFGTANDDFPPIHFQTRFQGAMVMFAPLPIVANYLNAHGGWFHRCAKPMQVEPFTDQGYILTVGKFGSFGYEVEPKIAVVFDPPVDNLYLMYNVPVPNDQTQGYAIDYKADMSLADISFEEAVAEHQSKILKKFGDRPVPECVTQIHWNLHLQVRVQFPKFIYKLPQDLIRSTGDRLLSSIVAQISPRLTTKIQQDFHSSHDLPLPPKGGSFYKSLDTASTTETDVDEKKEDTDNIPPQSIVV
ncbi:MAG: DUF1997 domain-containing protein [Limnothrix sp.]